MVGRGTAEIPVEVNGGGRMPRHNAAMLSPNSRCNDGPNSPHIHDRGCPKLWRDCMSLGLKRQGYRYALHASLLCAK